MNWEEIKEIIQADGGKFIIVENGKPVLVITSFEDYRNKVKTALKQQNPEGKTEKTVENEISTDELTIEDLPF